jgi:uncharacterized membrane protein
MVGFAVISYKDNGVGGLLSQGVGTSMLQIGNIMRKPVLWLAPTLTSAILGPVSTVWLEMTNNVAKVVAEPAREDIDLPIEEHLIVELYSK